MIIYIRLTIILKIFEKKNTARGMIIDYCFGEGLMDILLDINYILLYINLNSTNSARMYIIIIDKLQHV